MSKKSKYADLIEEVKSNNPTHQWNAKIKAGIAEIKSEPIDNSPTNPMGIESSSDSFASTRKEAEKIIENGRENNVFISQFVRPGKRKLLKVITDAVNGDVYKKFRCNPPVGVLVAFMNNHSLLIGWSKYNEKIETLPFSKKVAVETAVMRGLLDRIYPNGVSDYLTANDRHIHKAISKEIPNFIERVEKFFERTADNVGKFCGTG